MKTNTSQNKWMIDAVLFAGFIAAVLLDLTGLSLHQWLGAAIGALALYHISAHWNWVEAVTERFFGRTSLQARLFYLVDAALGLSVALILVTGLVISTWLSLSLGNYTAWKNVHILTSIAALLLIVVKIGTHWRWIVQVARRQVFSPATAAVEKRPARSNTAPRSTGRRDFLKLMGVVGAAAIIALGSAWDGVEGAIENENTASQQTVAQTSSSSSATRSNSTSLNSASVCSAMCPRGCSYPGHCRRYTDTNGNQRCDLGECA